MKLSNADIMHLSSILSLCGACNIESIIIEDNTIRGVDSANQCIILSDSNVPQFPQKFGINRVSLLRQRLELFANLPDFCINANESERGEITSLDLSAGKNKAQFRCTSTSLLKVPKNVGDEYVLVIKISKSEIRTILNAVRVMNSKKILLVIKKDLTVSFQFTDSSNDNCVITLDENAYSINDDHSMTVTHYYPVETLTTLLKMNADTDILEINIGQVGTLKSSINSHNILLLSMIDGDE